MKDKVALWVVYRLPRWIVYYCGIRLWAEATRVEGHAPDIRVVSALDHWAK